MNKSLHISLGQYSDKGIKQLNQDSYGAVVSAEPQLSLKGNAMAIADGISTSNVSQIASQNAIKSFLNDYFCTSEAWTVKTAGQKVIESINGWLFAQTQRSDYRFNKDKGYVCTFSSVILQGKFAHLFHVGDSRIYRIRNNKLEQLTKDHRSWTSSKQSYLSRALGVNYKVEIDYQALELQVGDTFILCTDGIYEFCNQEDILTILEQHHTDLEKAAKLITSRALKRGSKDNLTIQIAVINQLGESPSNLFQQQIDNLTLPSVLHVKEQFDGYKILRQLHSNSRSHVYLAEDSDTQTQVVIKIPSIDLRNEPGYLERLLMEEWVARRISSHHVMKAGLPTRQRQFLYSVMEYIDGISLKQWLVDNPSPKLETVRNIIEQVAKGLQAMHRKEILHQDLRPDNIMIDNSGTVKIIDFGGAKVAGIVESHGSLPGSEVQGTAMYTAPEYFIGDNGSARSDQYSLAVIVYHMLSGRFPYGTQVAKSRTVSAQKGLSYQSVLDDNKEIPVWVDYALRKALNPNPYKRYAELSEFIYALRQPDSSFLSKNKRPLIERNPMKFWKSLSLILFLTVLGLLKHIHDLTTLN